MSLQGKTLFVTGASRGIGLAIALRAAKDGANVAVAAKTETPHPKLEGTIYTAADEIEKAGGRALPLAVDVRDETAVKDAIERTAARFGGIDIVVNNASAISLSPVRETDMKRFDLMHQINVRGTFMVSKYAIAHLERAANPHILMLSPPLDMAEKWFAPHTGYTMAKFGMSMVALGLAGELRAKGIAVNALWPRTTIATAAIKNLLGGDAIVRRSRKPEIVADAAYLLFQKPARSFTGQFLIDDTFLAGEGVRDFDIYRVDPSQSLAPDFFVPDDLKPPPGVNILETVRHAGRNVKHITGLQGLVDSAHDRSPRGIVGIGPLLHVDKLSAGRRCRTAGADQPDVERLCVHERSICRFDDSDIDAVGAAFEDPLVQDLPGLQIFPDILQIRICKIGGFAGGSRWSGGRPALGGLSISCRAPERHRGCCKNPRYAHVTSSARMRSTMLSSASPASVSWVRGILG